MGRVGDGQVVVCITMMVVSYSSFGRRLFGQFLSANSCAVPVRGPVSCVGGPPPGLSSSATASLVRCSCREATVHCRLAAQGVSRPRDDGRRLRARDDQGPLYSQEGGRQSALKEIFIRLVCRPSRRPCETPSRSATCSKRPCWILDKAFQTGEMSLMVPALGVAPVDLRSRS